ncbi:MAG: AAA family ATPase [bacterium]|nr:AAA family ATPase [bacterium]
MEHLHHFGLTQDPFSNEPDLRFFFESGSHRDAQRRVERGLRQHKGLTLLTGDGGMGKTLLARRILDALEEEVFEAALLVMLPGAADAKSILQRFARQLGCEEPADDRAGLLAQIYEQLAIVREDGRHAVLMIDDAQIMTPDVFAELAGLLNLEYEDRRLVSMLFVGSSELDRLVQNDSSIMPRVDVRVRLQPLDMANAAAYLKHRLDAVGGDAAAVPAPAMEALFKFGRGRPRLLNTLADNALFEAYLGGRSAIDATDVERAAADLGIGPDPGTTYSQLSAAPVPPAPALAETPAAGTIPDDVAGAPAAGPVLDLDDGGVDDFVLAPEMAAPAVTPTLDLDEGLEDALEDAATPIAGAPPATPVAEMPVSSLEFDSDPPSVTQYPVDPPVRDAAAEAAGTSVAHAEILEAELTPLDDADGEPIDDAFVELIEE